MLTPEEEGRVLNGAAVSIDAEAYRAYERVLSEIRRGVPARTAVDNVIAAYTGGVAETVAGGLSKIMGAAVGSASVLDMRVGDLTLSSRLYALSDEVGATVSGIVDRHAKGFTQARTLALEIFEGYGFRKDEPLVISPRNPVLPKYLREDLLTDVGLRGDLARLYARIQASNLRSPSLRAAYLQMLDAIEEGPGSDLLGRKLEVAYYEKVRYYANRIAQTELHRAYAQRQAEELMRDSGVGVVQWRMSPTHPEVDICDFFARANLYGLGPGLYPKGSAPVAPAHPHCRCYLKPRTDLPLSLAGRLSPDAGRDWLSALSPQDAARVMGSRAKADAVLSGGADPWAAYNSGILRDAYRVSTVEEIAALRMLGAPDVSAEIVEQFWNPTTKAGAWHEASFAEGDRRLAALIRRVGDPGDVKLTPGTGAYARHSAYIEMDSEKIAELRGQSVWRHEYGHHIDGQISGRPFAYRSSAADFDAAIKADSRSMVRDSAAGNLYAATNKKRYEAIVNARAAAINEVKALESTEARVEYLRGRFSAVGIDFEAFRATMERHSDFATTLNGVGLHSRYAQIATALDMRDAQSFLDLVMGTRGSAEAAISGRKGSLGELSDLIGSVTLNKVGGLNQNGWGHSDAYYKKASFMRGTETFADLSALHGDANYPVWDKVLDRFVPQTNALFKGVLDGNP